MHSGVQIALGGLCLYLIYCGLLFLLQRSILFPGVRIDAPPGVVPSGLEVIWLDVAGGKVEAWYLPPAPGADPAPAMIFAHGNAELIDFWPEGLRAFTGLGLGVLLVEYPGYGRSKGVPSQKRIAEAFVAAYDTLVARQDVDGSRIVLLGRSLGGGAVCALAAERPSAALILLSTFTSVRYMASKFLVPGFLVRDPFDNLAVVAAYPGPVLVVHGTRDAVVPYTHGTALARSTSHARLLTYDTGHNTCPPDWDAFRQEVAVFLHRAGVLDGAPKP